jgi:hypothetical protein
VSRIEALRSDPVEWRKRGLRSPGELADLIARRLADVPPVVLPDPDARYVDFFTPIPAAGSRVMADGVLPEHRGVWERLHQFGDDATAVSVGR